MLEVIHGECCRFCVMVLSLIGEIFIHKVFHEIYYMLCVFIWIEYWRGAEEKFNIKTFSKAICINIAKISKTYYFWRAIMFNHKIYTNRIVVR